MSDPSLFDKLHGGIAPQKKPPQKTNSISASEVMMAKDSYEVAFEEAIHEQVNSLMASREGIENKMLSPGEKRAQLEQKVRASLDFAEFGSYIESAFKIIRTDGPQYLDKADYKSVMDSLDKLNQQLTSLDITKLCGNSLRNALVLPKKIQQLILKVGIDKFITESYDNSLALFSFLSLTDPEEPDYWYRLGLVAQKCENYVLALKAFAATSLLAPDFIGARIFAAQCYLHSGSGDDAEAELLEATRILKGSAEMAGEWQKYVEDIDVLLAEFKSMKRKE
ncbi:MAG: hypothetical protein H0T62_07490 [Parachlamydiaceae bacterium]|nr:hypothetical protein [Parachlamydiaceae bacterium]